MPIAARSASTKKKRRGVFYTPESISDILCHWTVRTKHELVLEPSFGGCGFIQSLAKRFEQLGHTQPGKSIFGCDIDARAFTHLDRLSKNKPIASHFIKGDFLQLTLRDFGVSQFDAVVGNPPYVSYHNMFGEQRKATAQLGLLGEFRLRKTSSLWAYFVLHSFQFLKPGGRTAWVLPGSLLNSDYGKELLHGIAPRFHRVVVISLTQRLFISEGTEESSEILLCEGWGRGPSKHGVEVRSAATVNQCKTLISNWHYNKWRGASLNGRAMYTLLPQRSFAEYYTLLQHPATTRLGDIAKVLIGIVTGANPFFVVDREILNQNDMRLDQVSLILSKFRFAPGLILRTDDLLDAYENEERCLLVSRSSLTQAASAVRNYFKSLPKGLIENNRTFAKRSVWHCPDDGKIPDAFFPYMNHIGPRLVLNSAAVNSTNTVHRLYFNPSTGISHKKLAAISMLTTFSQLSAEIEGRTYGAGVLKHEPTEAMSIRLFLPENIPINDVNRAAQAIDQLLRMHELDEARHKADTLIFGAEFLAREEKLLIGLGRNLRAARKRRY
jgi:adenine-specific DNA methylase